MMDVQFDVAVVGAGIVGLACAWEARRRGLSVVLFDRSPTPMGASIRNFGMVWPIGQPAGTMLDRALRSRERWIEASRLAGFWHSACGSLHAAYHPDELGVLEEFVAAARGTGHRVAMKTPAQACAMSPWLVRDGLVGGMYSELEVCVDSRSAIASLTAYLASEACGIDVRLGTHVTSVDPPTLTLSTGERVKAQRVCVCTGEDMRTLYPQVYKDSGLTPCKLQMMRTVVQPDGGRLGVMLAAGSTLRHYASFAHCPSLKSVQSRFASERPDMDRYGVHVLVSQTPAGELTIGDSHEYGEPVTPFLNQHVDRLILDYLATFLRMPEPQIAERWFGVYPKSMTGAPAFVASPHPCVRVINGVGGAGMTMSFGLAEDVFAGW